MKHLADFCRSRGVQVPSDVELLDNGSVFFFDEAGHAVQLGRVEITWRET